MPTDDWERVDELFAEALAVDVTKRELFLRERCGDDAMLFDRVSRLLRDHGRASPKFLEGPPLLDGIRGLPRASGPDPLIGRTIDAYTIREVIARGGMGTVYLAAQGSPRRDVALKTLSASLWSQSAERRFEFESQILARLQHPNIAQVYVAGTHRLETGATLHYFAMEYVPNARTITEYANEQQLDIRQRLELFVLACEAVQYGHQKGVIHRDLKPGNILVGREFVAANVPVGRRPAGTPDPTIKVIDFGVARCADSDVALTTMHTDTGQLIGTLAYMSPEQCDADPLGLDVRSDVYSLGVVLYELICGRLPYEVSKTNVYAATQAIKQSQPARPSTVIESVGVLARRSRQDLETIILKALEKDRARRYQNAADLAEDIRRFLRREPIAARPPTVWTRALRWVIGHPVRATIAACAGIAAITLSTTALAVYLINMRPHRIVLNPDCSTARLVTWYERPLHEWRGGAEASVKFGELITQPPQFGGRRLALIGFGEGENEFRNKLCAFDVDGDPGRPVWTKEIDVESEAPPSVVNSGRMNWGFHPAHALIADVFTESPGDEVVVVFSHPWSYRAIRVYGLDGKLLSQIWQRGGIGHPRWLRNPGLLILVTGDENEKLNGVRFSPLVMAIRLRPDPSNKRDPRESALGVGVKPEWYFYVHPPPTEEYDYTCEMEDMRTNVTLDDSHIGLRFVFSIENSVDAEADFRIMFDATGQEVAGSRRAGDTYIRHTELPNPEVFRLSKDPPSQADWPGKRATTTAPAS